MTHKKETSRKTEMMQKSKALGVEDKVDKSEE